MINSLYLFECENKLCCILCSDISMEQYEIDHLCKAEAEKRSFLKDLQGQLRASDSRTLRELHGEFSRMED